MVIDSGGSHPWPSFWGGYYFGRGRWFAFFFCFSSYYSCISYRWPLTFFNDFSLRSAMPPLPWQRYLTTSTVNTMLYGTSFWFKTHTRDWRAMTVLAQRGRQTQKPEKRWHVDHHRDDTMAIVISRTEDDVLDTGKKTDTRALSFLRRWPILLQRPRSSLQTHCVCKPSSSCVFVPVLNIWEW